MTNKARHDKQRPKRTRGNASAHSAATRGACSAVFVAMPAYHRSCQQSVRRVQAFVFVSVDADDEEGEPVMEFFNLAKKDLPALWGFQFDPDQKKYRCVAKALALDTSLCTESTAASPCRAHLCAGLRSVVYVSGGRGCSMHWSGIASEGSRAGASCLA